MKETSNYGLNLPEQGDFYNVDDFNENTEVIDEVLDGTQRKIEAINANATSHLGNRNNPHNVTATQVGLGNVNNTSDTNKPISTAVQNALDGKANVNNGTLTGLTNAWDLTTGGTLRANNSGIIATRATINGDLNCDDIRCQRIDAGADLMVYGQIGIGGNIFLTVNGLNFVNHDNTNFVTLHALSFNAVSSKLIKENVRGVAEDEVRKLLELEPIHFDYKKCVGGKKDNYGFFAEDVLEKLPDLIDIPEGYDSSKFDPEKGIGQDILSVDYSKFVPLMLKLLQMHQAELDGLRARL